MLFLNTPGTPKTDLSKKICSIIGGCGQPIVWQTRMSGFDGNSFVGSPRDELHRQEIYASLPENEHVTFFGPIDNVSTNKAKKLWLRT